MFFGAVNIPRGSDIPTQEMQLIVEHAEYSCMVIETGGLLEKHSDFVKNCQQLISIFVVVGSAMHTFINNVSSGNDLPEVRRYSPRDIDCFLVEGENFDQKIFL